jgi:predicted XRE-type DNA-binding protein
MEPTIRIQSRLGKRRQRKRADAASGSIHDDGTPALPSTDTMARRLALAHYIERLIDAGTLRNYAQAAAVLGITRARMTQLMDLVLLSPDVQESVLLGVARSSERGVRARLGEHSESQEHDDRGRRTTGIDRAAWTSRRE